MSRSWRLISQYSLISTSQTEMFARIRRATEGRRSGHELQDDWAVSAIHITRVLSEQAPIRGFAGMSEGATAASVYLVQHSSGL